MVEDFSFGLDENNAEYVEFIESPTKTRQSGLSAKPRSFLPKNFYWRWKMSRYNLHQRVSVAPSSRNTYNRSTLFVLCVKPFLASLVQATTDGSEQAQWHGEDRNQTGTTLQDSWKTFSNHSARKTVVKKLKTAGLERSSIVKITGHRNEKSLDDYDEGDENEQRLLSHTISNGTNINSQLARGHSSTSVHTSTNSSSTTFNPSSLDARGNNFNPAGFAFQMSSYISGQNDQRQFFMNMNHFHQCQVTFNIGSTAAPEKPQSAPQWETTVSCSAASWRRQYFALTDHDQFSFRKKT